MRPYRDLQTTNRIVCSTPASGALGLRMRPRWLSPPKRTLRAGRGRRFTPPAPSDPLRRAPSGRRGGSLASDAVFPHPVGASRPRPNGFTNAATRPLHHRRANPSWGVPRPPRGSLPRLHSIRNRLGHALGVRRMVAPPPPPGFRFGPKRRGAVHRSGFRTEIALGPGRPSPMRRAHRLGTRRCSYRFCHRIAARARGPCFSNLAGPAARVLAGRPANHATAHGLPRRSSVCLPASGFEQRGGKPPAGPKPNRPSPAPPPSKPGSVRPPLGADPDLRGRCAASLCRRVGAVAECGDIRHRQTPLPYVTGGSSALVPTREGGHVPWTRDAIHRVPSGLPGQAGDETPVRARLRGPGAQTGARRLRRRSRSDRGRMRAARRQSLA